MSICLWEGTETSVSICPYGTLLLTQTLLLLQMLSVTWNTAVQMLFISLFSLIYHTFFLKNIISCFYTSLLSNKRTTRRTNLEIKWVDSLSGYSYVFLMKCLFCSLFIHSSFPILNKRGHTKVEQLFLVYHGVTSYTNIFRVFSAMKLVHFLPGSIAMETNAALITCCRAGTPV